MAASDGRFDLQTLVAGPGIEKEYARLIEMTRRKWVDADEERGRNFYICGVGKGVIALRDLLRGSGYERRAVRYEQW
jgi:hypothetical protein